jgi:translation initiation factor IF-2
MYFFTSHRVDGIAATDLVALICGGQAHAKPQTAEQLHVTDQVATSSQGILLDKSGPKKL